MEESFQGNQELQTEAPPSHPSFVTRPTPMEIVEVLTIGATSMSRDRSRTDKRYFDYLHGSGSGTSISITI